MPIINAGGGGGGGGTSMLFDSLLAAGAASIDTGANGIALTGKHLLIVATVRSNVAATQDTLNLTFNNDTAAHYNSVRLQTANATVTGAPFAAVSNLNVTIPGSTATANTFGSLNMTVIDYTNATTFKCVQWTGGDADAVAASTISSAWSGIFAQAASISRCAIAPSAGTQLVAGSRLTVYALN
jgi:hypothetical protein